MSTSCLKAAQKMPKSCEAVPYVLQLFPLHGQFLHLHAQFLLSLGQLEFLGRDDLDDSVVYVHGSRPLAQTLARGGRFLHDARLKVRVRNEPGGCGRE